MIEANNAIPLIAYSDKLSVRPMEKISFKVSSTLGQPFNAWLMRSISADPNPEGPGIIEEHVGDAFPEQTFLSRYQSFSPGSYAISKNSMVLSLIKGFKLKVRVFSTLSKASKQTIFNINNLSLFIDEDGAVALRLGDKTISPNVKLNLRQWYQLEASYDAKTNQLAIEYTLLASKKSVTSKASAVFDLSSKTLQGRVCIAAELSADEACNYFNGKLESPAIYENESSEPERLLTSWDFSNSISTNTVQDNAQNQYELELVNLPSRAVTGSNWDATEMCWRHKPEHYGAIHFHDDDIYDFNWKTDFSFNVPANLTSGIYVMRIKSGDFEDALPFFVCPPLGTKQAKLCVLIPTFTYVVYGNHARTDFKESWKERIKNWSAYPHNPAEYKHYGLSTYNFHSDGSGICYASHRRPLLNLRPGFITFGDAESSGLRHFQADSHLISWLHAKNISYDIITDNELHNEGLQVLDGYDVVTTTTHPEYHTLATLDALQDYRDTGGNLLYLGGNGFYWRVALHQQQEGAIEIRRAEDGIRAWAAEPGEYYNAFDGQYGGLWRRNGRPPQMLAGVGFSAQGEFNGSYYLRKSNNTDYDWIFNCVEGDIIGDFGFSGGGAAGFELDRLDYRLGSPQNTEILASSTGHGDGFILVPEEQLTHLTNWPGLPEADLLRADMIYFDVPGGGSVFATGSITFCGSLPWNNYNNNVSTILHNVISHKLNDDIN
jgi:N,N-dimethylformamidase